MEKRTLRISALVACCLALAWPALAGTYKWVDENGKVHYSDKPVEGAEEVRLPELPTYRSDEEAAAAATEPDPEAGAGEEDPADQERVAYEGLGFISPKPEQTFWNIATKLPVQLQVQPGLQPGDQVKLYVNGQLRAGPSRSLAFTLNEMYRGTYSIRATIEDSNGEIRASAGPVTFHIKQTSIKN